jgi:hypothetical protein
MAKTRGTTVNLEDSLKGYKVAPGHGASRTPITNGTAFTEKDASAPINSRVIASETKSTYYQPGVHPGSLSQSEGAGAMGLEGRAPTIDSPVPKGAEMPHKGDRSKVDEVSHADPRSGLGVTFNGHGVMGRE